MTRIKPGLEKRRQREKKNIEHRTWRGGLTIWLLPIDGSTRIRGRGREYDLAPYAVPLRRGRRGVIDGPQY